MANPPCASVPFDELLCKRSCVRFGCVPVFIWRAIQCNALNLLYIVLLTFTTIIITVVFLYHCCSLLYIYIAFVNIISAIIVYIIIRWTLGFMILFYGVVLILISIYFWKDVVMKKPTNHDIQSFAHGWSEMSAPVRLTVGKPTDRQHLVSGCWTQSYHPLSIYKLNSYAIFISSNYWYV